MSGALFGPASGRDPPTLCFNMFELKIFHNRKLLERVRKISPIKKVFPRVNSIALGLRKGRPSY